MQLSIPRGFCFRNNWKKLLEWKTCKGKLRQNFPQFWSDKCLKDTVHLDCKKSSSKHLRLNLTWNLSLFSVITVTFAKSFHTHGVSSHIFGYHGCLLFLPFTEVLLLGLFTSIELNMYAVNSLLSGWIGAPASTVYTV